MSGIVPLSWPRRRRWFDESLSVGIIKPWATTQSTGHNLRARENSCAEIKSPRLRNIPIDAGLLQPENR
jgi:hypothetical protein